jgi:hypothetical protein
MCNIPIYLTSIYNTCHVLRKHLKYLKHTIVTCAFSVASACCLDEWRLIDAELNAVMELEVAEWRGGHRCGLVSGTNLGSGRRMEHGCDGRRKSVSELASA